MLIKIKSLFQEKYLLLGLIAILIIVYGRWFFNLDILTSGDWPYAVKNAIIDQYLGFLDIWRGNTGFGNLILDIGQAPSYIFYGIFAKFLGFEYNISERIIHLLPIAVITPLSSYFLLKNYFKNRISAFVGSIIYSYNTYFLFSDTGHLTLMTAFALAPILLHFVHKTFDTGKNRYVALSAVFGFTISAYEPRGFYVIAMVIGLYVLFSYYFGDYKYDRKKLNFITLKLMFIMFLILLLNIFWILALLNSNSLTSNTLLNRDLFGNVFWTLSNSLTLHHPWWSGSHITAFINQPIPLYFWMIPIFAFLGLFLNRRNRHILFFGLVALLGILLSKQVSQPLTTLYPWLFEHFPGFNAFREASKFYYLVALGYAVLIGGFVDWMWQNLSKQKWQIYGKYLFTLLIITIFLFNTKPIITGEIGTLFVPRHIPQDYLVLNDFILKQREYFRTIWVPRDSRWGIFTNQNPKISNVTVIGSDLASLLQNYNENEKLIQNRIINLFKLPFADRLIDVSSIKYVIVPLQDNANDDDFYKDYGGDKDPNIRQWYIDQLDKVSWLKKIDIGTKDLVVYENANYKEPISSFTKLYSLDSTNNLDAKYSFINTKLNGQFYFTSPTPKNDISPTTNTFVPFDNLGSQNISSNSLLLATTSIDTQKNTAFYRVGSIAGRISINNSVVPYGSMVSLNLPAGENDMTYQNPAYSFTNLIPNSSFEMGTWQPKVGDCHNYDNNPILSMSLNKTEKSDGAQSLQLEATRHIACTAINIPVKAGAHYLLSFDYQSSDKSPAAYYVGFNDTSKTIVSATLPTTDTSWRSFSQTITVPSQATTLSLFIYARATYGTTNNINRYDNFKLIEVPDISNSYYLVSQPKDKLVEPQSVSFDLINPTKKLVHIKGATTPFFLAMSESYHDQWQVQMNNAKVQGVLNSWWPFAKPDAVPSAYHYQLNGFLNAWYVDTAQLCAGVESEKLKDGCTKNADGSYDIEMVIEFWPQRWFYLGLLISCATLAGCLGYLGYDFYKRRKLKVVQ